MAGNKITTKTKGKDDKSKINKIANSEESDDLDFSLLRKPILTSITGFAQARKIFDLATEELKGLISNECDLLYECKVCRNIFRSLANFISHKRVYCKEEFNTSLHGNFNKVSSTANEIQKIKKLEESYFESLNSKEEIEILDADEVDNRIPLTKDLTAIVEKIASVKGLPNNITEDPQLVLQKIPSSNVAVFQNVDNTGENTDKMRNQIKELDKILSQDKAILQKDGKFKISSSLPCDSDNVIQISDDEDNDDHENLKCKICDQSFSTQKTLKFHMKYKHLESRLVYPCPDCLEIFSTSWSVYRHLFKVHRKTAAQIRRLRESIQAKAFKMNNPPAFYERRKNMKPPSTQKISEEERLDQENQAWMDNVEGEGDVPRCFGCGRTFERRAALAAHTHTCQPRSRALARRPDAKKIEIQIRKDYNKGPSSLNLALKPTEANENKISSEESTTKGTEKQIENDKPQETPMDTTETNEKESTPEKNKDANTQSLKSFKISLKLPFAQHIEKSNLIVFRQKIQPNIEVTKLLCKKCDLQHETVQELYQHMAEHFKWLRYACKLCNFKHYDFEKLPEHVKVVHKLRGDSDFYFSTVKAIDGNEALELSECVEETTEINDTSPDSRRPSRCSSDSSRVSDDSSSGSTRAESGSRKRKMEHNKGASKRKRETIINDDDEDRKLNDGEKDTTDNDNLSLSKFEENSSDMDDIDEKISKRRISTDIMSINVPSRRPVRKKTKIKNADFEYDLSNLLKMEAQGYRDSQTTVAKTNQNKKKPTQDSNYYEMINKDSSGALATLSKKAVDDSTAHLKNTTFISIGVQKDLRPSNVFIRPMLPKILSKGDKNSPKKDVPEEPKENPTISKESKLERKEEKSVVENEQSTSENIKTKELPKPLEKDSKSISDEPPALKEQMVVSNNTVKPINIPTVLPIKFRRQSLEVIKKSPLINKNITDFQKAGMKTKILVIKPIHRNKDGTPVSKTPLKFQTIKLKDASRSSSSNEEKSSDQVVVVKVPKVECVNSRSISDTNTVSQSANNSQTIHDTNTVSQSINNSRIISDTNTASQQINNSRTISDMSTVSEPVNNSRTVPETNTVSEQLNNSVVNSLESIPITDSNSININNNKNDTELETESVSETEIIQNGDDKIEYAKEINVVKDSIPKESKDSEIIRHTKQEDAKETDDIPS